jgi:hypothetical protein
MSEKRVRVLFELDTEGEGEKGEAFLLGVEQAELHYLPNGTTVEGPWESTPTISYEDLVRIQECINEMYAMRSARRKLS